ncbi:hypothetical protein XOC_1446 [Xanthomonas oryzae pv. oryzicola BLS256]|uniref:Uncharacterized protein n=1 Tax=Xanthomonas oryzae pv. oryzicola (strain BLS256) TaxID=383407 RepID=G7TIZ9_XANOB|nr:hypothetical protein XOC_1446 [Xanthomonas oryzae pv. oryzicola BLS256]QEO98476.1 hypothetical protein XOCgx_3487 [Xanthomonas oryzae pv. oryzicola]
MAAGHYDFCHGNLKKSEKRRCGGGMTCERFGLSANGVALRRTDRTTPSGAATPQLQ